MRKLARDTSSLWLSRHWPCWLILIFGWFVVKLPYRWLMRIGKCLGGFSYYLPTHHKDILFSNLDLCFPQWSPQEKQDLAYKNFQSAGMAVFETLLAWLAPDRKIRHLLTVRNPQRMRQFKEGRLAIVPHHHAMLIASRIYCLNIEEGASLVSTAYRPSRKAVINKFSEAFYKKISRKAIPSTSMREMVRSLRARDILCFFSDIDPGKEYGVFSNFFGVPACTVSGVGKLASLGKAKVMPMYFLRRDDLSGYDLYPGELLEDLPSGDKQKDADIMNACFEEIIRKHPEQYLWQYKRFKTCPAGVSKRYPSRKRIIKKRQKNPRADVD
jgi:Kdo2-lipid IVA lauroyltransferase/acyltransferase